MATEYITTVKSTGGDYASLNAWQAGWGSNTGTHNGDLVSADAIETAECYSFPDTATVIITGWLTSATQYIKVYTPLSERSATGIFDNTKYYLNITVGANATYAIDHRVNYACFEGIQIQVTNGVYTNDVALLVQSITAGGSDIYVDKCIFQATGFSGSGTCQGIQNSDADGTLTVRNSICYGFQNGANAMSSLWCGAGTMNVYNCVSTKSYRGSRQTGGTMTITNSALFNNSSVDYTGTITATYCASDDTKTGTGNIDWNLGATDWAANFTDYANDDYSLKSTAPDLIDAGTDLSGSGVTDDIIGTTRSTHDIGAFEYVSAAAAGNPWNYYAQQ